MSILIFLLVLSALVLIHEAGHFFAAKWSGVKPEEFGIGFPPRAIGWVKRDGKWQRVKKGEMDANGTIWSINWLPLGGFVRLKGEQGEAASEKDSFAAAALWKKFIIIAAGVVMNWVLATAIFTSGYLVGVPMETSSLPANVHVSNRSIEVTQIVAGSPAEQSGLKVGDAIRSVNGQAVTSSDETRTRLREASLTENVRLTIVRNGSEESILAHPAVVEGVTGRGIGVGFGEIGTVRWPWWQAPFEGIKATAFYTKMIVSGLFGLVRDLVVTRHVSQQVSGPLGIAVITGQVAHQGVWALLNFAAILSINLAVVNFLPIPGLDGGRAIFLLAEFARRKRISPTLEATIHGIGFIALLILIVLVTIQDLFHYGPGIWQGIASKF